MYRELAWHEAMKLASSILLLVTYAGLRVIGHLYDRAGRIASIFISYQALK